MKTTFALLVLLIGAVGCADKRSPASGTAALTQVDHMELYSILPSMPRGPNVETLCGYPVRGHATIDDPAERTQLADALRRGSSEWVGTPSFALACKPRPHHGLRVEHAGVTTDYAICFECSDTIGTSSDGKPIPSFQTDGTTAKPLFDAALRRHGLPVAEDAMTRPAAK